MGTPLPHQTMQSKAIQFYEFPTSSQKKPYDPEGFKLSSKKPGPCYRIGQYVCYFREGSDPTTNLLLHRERAPESPQSRGGGAEESHPVGTDISDMLVPIHHSLPKLTPRPTSWKKCHFSMKSYELWCPQSHQLCSPYFGRAYEELTSSYIRDTRDDRSFSPLRTRPCWLT